LVDPFIGAIVQSIELPENWLQEVEEQVGKDEELESLQRTRNRLKKELRRVKRLYIQGEFGEDLDIYIDESARIQRELNSIPTYDQLESLSSTVEVIDSLHEIWDKAEKVDQHDLVQLMFRKVWVDVEEGRVVAVAPKALMFPVFREVHLLEEREFGYFVPRWDPKQAKELVSFSYLDAFSDAPEHGFALPFVVNSPLMINQRKRIAPGISQALKKEREIGQEPETIVQVVTSHRPKLPVDLRKWPQASKINISPKELREQPAEHIDILITQLLLWDAITNEHSPDDYVFRTYKQMKPKGVWYQVELLPRDMPAHWLYRYFPAAWEWSKLHAWSLHTLYNQLRNQGFQVDVKRHLYYQPVFLSKAMMIAERRPGMLANLSDEVFEEGLNTLREELHDKGDDYLLGSEFALVEVWAQKPQPVIK